ncbi:MAG: hypothetical protein ABI678_32300 [Kofleriaceae bacterium]
MTAHLDESGAPCVQHPPPTAANLMALALLGSRMPSFHHDVASKLQSLMMAVDELSELAETIEARAAANAAMISVKEITQLFAMNRALAKAPQRRPCPIGELFAGASERSGVQTVGELPAGTVDIALPSIAHACAVILDLAAGPLTMGRSVDLVGELGDQYVTVTVSGPPSTPLPANAGDMLALASFALAREGGELRCGPDRYVIKLALTR